MVFFGRTLHGYTQTLVRQNIPPWIGGWAISLRACAQPLLGKCDFLMAVQYSIFWNIFHHFPVYVKSPHWHKALTFVVQEILELRLVSSLSA